jgi:hypothetical protein
MGSKEPAPELSQNATTAYGLLTRFHAGYGSMVSRVRGYATGKGGMFTLRRLPPDVTPGIMSVAYEFSVAGKL